MKKYMNWSLFYALLAMASGVFYREFTKIMGYEASTRLSLIHGHYFTLGLFFFLILLILVKQFGFSNEKTASRWLLTYHVGLNITGLAFLARGLMEVLAYLPNKGLNASISGIAGLGHILLGVSMVTILMNIKGSVPLTRS